MTEDYFAEMKEWSERKLALLRDYLVTFVKILGRTVGEVFYVDGFAGPGIYGDGSKGSPIRAAEHAQTLVEKPYQLKCINVEENLEWYEDLAENTASFEAFTKNYCGTFGAHVGEIIGRVKSRPAIFFLDPFGLKGIEWRHIEPVLKRPYTTEVLLRVNPVDIGRLAGFLGSPGADAPGKRRLLTLVYGFADEEDWIRVWKESGLEGLFELYLGRIRARLARIPGQAFVAYYPIRTIEGIVKYYLVFATRHPKGATVMSNIVYGRERSYERDVAEYKREKRENQIARQLDMFEEFGLDPTEEEIFADLTARLKEDIWKRFAGQTASRLFIHAAVLAKWFGKIKGPHVTQALKELEEEERIVGRVGNPSDDDATLTFAPLR